VAENEPHQDQSLEEGDELHVIEDDEGERLRKQELEDALSAQGEES
jgi:hypothetical protein